MYWKNYRYIQSIKTNIKNRFATFNNKNEAIEVMNRLNRASPALSMKHLQDLLKFYLDKKLSKDQLVRYLKIQLGLKTSPIKQPKLNNKYVQIPKRKGN